MRRRGDYLAKRGGSVGLLATKWSWPVLVAAALIGVIAAYAPARGGDEKIFKGEIADTQCALNVHSLSQSHKEMIEMKPEVKTNAECANIASRSGAGSTYCKLPIRSTSWMPRSWPNSGPG